MPIITVVWSNQNVSQEKILKLIPRLKWKQEDAQKYQQKLDQNLALLNESYEFTDIHSDQLLCCIRNSSPSLNSNVFPRFKQKWFDKECMKARKKSFSLLNALLNSNCDILKSWYFEANMEYKKLCLVKKTEYEKNQACRLGETKNSKEFWKITREINDC